MNTKYNSLDYYKAGIVLMLLCLLAIMAGDLDGYYKNISTLREEKVHKLIQSPESFHITPGNKHTNKVTTWEELGTDRAELESLARLSRVQSLKTSLNSFRNVVGHDPNTIEYIVNEFVKAVESKVTTWEELGTDPTELEKLARLNRVQDLKMSLKSFRKILGHDPNTIEYIVNEFVGAVKSNVTTWEELGTDRTELKSLAEQNKAKEKMK